MINNNRPLTFALFLISSCLLIIILPPVTRCYGLIYTFIIDFLEGIIGFRGPLWIFAGRYESVTHCSDVTVYANTGIVEQHKHYRIILIVINLVIYKLCIFLTAVGI